MADSMTGMFGPSADEIRAAQAEAMRQSAQGYAQMKPLDRATMGMYEGGANLVNTLAPAFGLKNKAVANAQRTEQIMGTEGTDLSTSAGLLAKADEFRKAGDLRTATALALKGQELRKQEAAAAHLTAKDDLAERRFQEAEKVKIANDAQAKADALAARVQMAADKLAADEREGKRDDERRRELARMANMLGYAQIEARKAAAAAAGSKPLTALQQAKLDKERSASSAAIRAQDSEIESLGSDIAKVVSNEYLGRATGVRGILPSVPGGKASEVEGQLDSIGNRLKAQGLKVLREGGGIGAITEKEWDILANQVANIDRKRGADYVKGELEKVNLRMREMQRNATQRHYEQFGEEYSGSRDKPAPGLPTQDAIAAEIARRKGGK